MGATEFIFAFFVFLLICFTIWFNKRLNNGKKNQVQIEKEKQLFKLFQNLDDMMNSIEEYLEESRGKIASDRERSELTLEKIEELYQRILAEQQEKNDKIEKNSTEGMKKITKREPVSAAEPPRMANKNQQVSDLKKAGMGESQIARELGISRSEVALILDMDNNQNSGNYSH